METDGRDIPMRYRTARLISAVLSLILLAAACSGPGAGQTGSASQSNAGQDRKGGTLRVSTLGSLPNILHPYPQTQDYTEPLLTESTLMGSGLINLDANTLDWAADQSYVMATGLPSISAD